MAIYAIVVIETVYLSLGSNLGDRRENLARALEELSKAGVEVLKSSSLYETEPQDLREQPWFLNIVIEAQTLLSPWELLEASQKTEKSLGRVRAGAMKKGPRLIDIDILLFGVSRVAEDQLIIPHPRMAERRFVLEPLSEISPELRHPQTGVRFRDLLPGVCNQEIRKLEI